MKKLILTFIAAVTLFATPVYAEGSSDTPSKWAKEIVDEAISLGLVPERLQSNYQAPITRDEFAEMLVQTVMAKHNDYVKKYHPELPLWTIPELLERVTLDVTFEDADEDYIKAAYILGSINGVTETKFAPDQLITRQEAATMLMNTVHYSSGIVYSQAVQKSYKDFDKIAKWAQPAVLAAKAMIQGVGDKFDYAGLFTREQAISTMIRLYKVVNYTHLTLRGIAPMWVEMENTHFTVGKDYIYVDYPDEKYWENNADHMAAFVQGKWDQYFITNQYGEMPSIAQGAAVYLFEALQTSMEEVAQASFENKSITVDFGYMVYKTLTKDHVIEINIKPHSGYMTILAGYTYGYPKVNVEPKVIKIGE